MRHLATAALLLTAAGIGCDGSAPVQPMAPQLAPVAFDASPNPGKRETDPGYQDGSTVYILGARLIPNAEETNPTLFERAGEVYILVFPQEVTPTPGAGPITLPSGYQPQCDPCFHPGAPPFMAYHDHVLNAGQNAPAWKAIMLMYDPTYVASPDFQPITSTDDLYAAEAAGGVFLPINQGGDNPYEIVTGGVLIGALVSGQA